MKINEFFKTEGKDYEIILLTEEHLQMALEYEQKIMKMPQMSKPNYTNLSADRRYYIGFLGELAFKLWLDKKGITHTWNINTPLGADFDINGKTFDVKTASIETHEYLMFPASQLFRQRDFYVACKLCKDKVVIYGVLSDGEIAKLPVKDFGKGVPTKYKELMKI